MKGVSKGLEANFVSIRFEADDVGNALPLVSSGVADLPHRVHELHAEHPFLCRELHLACKIVDMPDERGEDLPRPGCGLGANGIDDILGEVRIEPRGRWRCHELEITNLRYSQAVTSLDREDSSGSSSSVVCVDLQEAPQHV